MAQGRLIVRLHIESRKAVVRNDIFSLFFGGAAEDGSANDSFAGKKAVGWLRD